jgi:hypothetical protein
MEWSESCDDHAAAKEHERLGFASTFAPLVSSRTTGGCCRRVRCEYRRGPPADIGLKTRMTAPSRSAEGLGMTARSSPLDFPLRPRQYRRAAWRTCEAARTSSGGGAEPLRWTFRCGRRDSSQAAHILSTRSRRAPFASRPAEAANSPLTGEDRGKRSLATSSGSRRRSSPLASADVTVARVRKCGASNSQE